MVGGRQTANRAAFRQVSIIFIGLLLVGSSLVAGTNRVVGYYPDWVNDDLPGDYLDFTILTHVNHAFAWPTSSGEIESYAGMLDVELNVDIHENGGNILLSFGGWGNSDGFGPMTADPVTRKTFVTNLIETCQTYEYDGVDFDWEHPSNKTETDNYTLLMQEIREAADSTFDNFLITMAIPGGNWSGQYYDLDALSETIDWFNVMTYDYHGTWTNHAGHNSPLYPSPSNDPDGSCHTSMNYVIQSRGVNIEKVNMGIAFYGKEFNASAINGGSSGGNITYQYNSILNLIDAGWSYQWDAIAQVPYIQNPEKNKLVTFDDPRSVRLKCNYAAERGLGGVMMWALGQDVVDGEEVLLEAIRGYSTSIDTDNSPPGLTQHELSVTCYPNPFNPSTTIYYNLPEHSHIIITIYDVTGREVATLKDQEQSAGHYEARWYGVDERGNRVSTGMYFCRLQTGGFSKTIKMVYLK